jgi:hypothetical protein
MLAVRFAGMELLPNIAVLYVTGYFGWTFIFISCILGVWAKNVHFHGFPDYRFDSISLFLFLSLFKNLRVYDFHLSQSLAH